MLKAALWKYLDSLEGQHWDWEMAGQLCFDPRDLSQGSFPGISHGAVQGRVSEAVAQPTLSLPAFPKQETPHSFQSMGTTHEPLHGLEG